jgi:hypothetical protein
MRTTILQKLLMPGTGGSSQNIREPELEVLRFQKVQNN